MGVKLGSKAKVAIGSTAIGKITSSSPTISTETVDGRHYGDEWAKPIVVGRSMSGSIEGHLDPDDGKQAQIRALFIATTATSGVCADGDFLRVDDFRIYEDATYYYTSATGVQSDAHFVLSEFSFNPDLSGLISFTCNYESYGPVTRTS